MARPTLKTPPFLRTTQRCIQNLQPTLPLKTFLNPHRLQSGRIGWILLWLLGVPIPVLLILYFIRGCT